MTEEQMTMALTGRVFGGHQLVLVSIQSAAVPADRPAAWLYTIDECNRLGVPIKRYYEERTSGDVAAEVLRALAYALETGDTDTELGVARSPALERFVYHLILADPMLVNRALELACEPDAAKQDLSNPHIARWSGDVVAQLMEV